MAILGTDLSVQITSHPPTERGLMVRGHIGATMPTVTERFGEPDRQVSSMDLMAWTVWCPAGCARLSLMAGSQLGDDPSAMRQWNIEAGSDSVLPWLYKVITGSTVGFPSAVGAFFGESSLDSLTAAYTDYLFLRSRAEGQRLRAMDRDDPRYQAERYLPEQLNTLALEARRALLDDRWAHASREERNAWANMARPAQTGRDPLGEWHLSGRWLYPNRPETPVDHADVDLAAALLRLADQYVEERPDAERRGHIELRAYDEAEATLRALATTPIPGIDALRRK